MESREEISSLNSSSIKNETDGILHKALYEKLRSFQHRQSDFGENPVTPSSLLYSRQFSDMANFRTIPKNVRIAIPSHSYAVLDSV